MFEVDGYKLYKIYGSPKNEQINKNKNKLTSIKQQQQQQVLRQLNGKEKLAKHGKVCLVAVK